jgi:hypothetical protein
MARRVRTDLDFGSELRIKNLPNPVDPEDAATKAYVDSVAGGGGGSTGFPPVSSLPSSASIGQTAYYSGIPFIYDGYVWQPVPERGWASCWRGVYTAFPGSNSLTGRGISLSATGTATAYTSANTDRIAAIPAVEVLVTTAATNAVAGVRINTRAFRLGPIGTWGFLYLRALIRNATGSSTATTRGFFGLRGSANAPTDVNPSTLTNIIGIGWDSDDNYLSIIHNDGSGAASKTSLGTSFPRPTADRSEAWDLQILSDGQGNVDWSVRAFNSGSVAAGVLTTDIPTSDTLLTFLAYISVGGTSSVIGIGVSMVEILQVV